MVINFVDKAWVWNLKYKHVSLPFVIKIRTDWKLLAAFFFFLNYNLKIHIGNLY